MGLLFLVSLAIGGMKGFVPVLLELVSLIVGVGFVVLVVWALIRKSRSQGSDQLSDSVLNSEMQNRPMPAAGKVVVQRRQWTETEIIECLRKIDWYQFEKLNAAILGKEGWVVERKGGAKPDGGVDLVATKDGSKMLVQCKHWRSWKIQLKIVNEMLGSMTHFGVTAGAIHTLTGWTGPAAGMLPSIEFHCATKSTLPGGRGQISLTTNWRDGCSTKPITAQNAKPRWSGVRGISRHFGVARLFRAAEG